MKSVFGEDDLRELCFELKIQYEDIPGFTRQIKIIELIYHTYRRGEIGHLVALCQLKRPHIVWPDTTKITLEPDSVSPAVGSGHGDDLRIPMILRELQSLLVAYLQEIKHALKPKMLDEFLKAKSLPHTPGRPLLWWEEILSTGEGIQGGFVTFLGREDSLLIRDLSTQLKVISQEYSQYSQMYQIIENVYRQVDTYHLINDRKTFRQDNLQDHIKSIQKLASILEEFS